MSAYHRLRIVDEFRRCGGSLTRAQLAAVGGWRWPERVREMRAHGYRLDGEDAAGCWHLDLDELPAEACGGVRRAAVAAECRAAWEGDGSSPGASDPDREGEVEGQPALFDLAARRRNPYDLEVA